MSSKRAAFAIAVALTCVFFVDWCNVVFQCGCRSLWNGIATACNIHAATGPHCPWCEHPLLGGGAAFGAAVLAQWATVHRTALTSWKRVVLAVVSFPVASGIVAMAQRFLWDYWPR